MIGIILSSQRVTPELSIDFGDISSSEIPIANQPLINLQYDVLSQLCDEVYVTRREKYKGYKLSSKKITEIQVGEDLSLVKLILSLIKRFKNHDVLILYGDTLIEYPHNLDYSSSKIFVTQDIKIRYPNWFEVEKGLFFCGSLFFNKETISEVVGNEYGDITKLLGSIKNFEHCLLPSGKWHDFGHFHTYFNSKKSFLESRVFNNISITNNGFIRKSSAEIGKMIYEYNWLSEAEKLFPSIIPKVRNLNFIADECSYEVEYFNYPTLSDIFVFGNINSVSEKAIIRSLVKQLQDFQKFTSIENADKGDFLSNKLKERKEDILKIELPTGIDLQEVESLIESNINYFSRVKFDCVFMHGDYCFSNILYNRRTDQIKLIDPRGYIDKREGFSIYGPIVYDYFKLAHSYIGHYDSIIAGINPDDFDIDELEERLNFFCDLTSISQELMLQGMINLFLSMIPLHSDNIIRQKHFMNISFKLVSLL